MPGGHAELTKSMQAPKLVLQLSGKAAIGDACMDGLLAADGAAELSAIKWVQDRHYAGKGLNAPATIGRAVARCEH